MTPGRADQTETTWLRAASPPIFTRLVVEAVTGGRRQDWVQARGQSTVETAIALPAVAFLLWWSVAVPCAAIRSMAVRVAAFSGVRRAVADDGAGLEATEAWIARHLADLTGDGDAETEVRMWSGRLEARTQEEWGPIGVRVGTRVALPVEKD